MLTSLADTAEEYAAGDYGDIDLADQTQDQFLPDKIRYINHLTVDGPEGTFSAAEYADSVAQTLLGSWLTMMGTDGYNQVALELAWNTKPDPRWGTIFRPQLPVGDFTLDFVFKICSGGEYRVVAVECTDLDSEHDPRQLLGQMLNMDRQLLAAGVRVIRFTDDQVLRDPQQCVDEVISVLSDVTDELLVQAGLIAEAPSRGLRKSMTPISRRNRRPK